MKILAFETSAKAVSCAVAADGAPIASAWQQTGLTHSRTLMPMVESMLQNSDLALSDMDAIAVAVGPGSFTGLRIGIAAAKGLAWGAEKPCIAVSTLEAMATPLSHMAGHLILCAMDARRQQIYNAVFLAQGGALTRLVPDRAVALEELAAELAGEMRPITVVGDGAALCHGFLTQAGIPCAMAPIHLRAQSAVGVGLAAEALAKAGKLLSPQALAPVYLRLSQAERERLEKLREQR